MTGGGLFTGTLNMLGGVYGEFGDELAGGIGGTLTSAAGDTDIGGSFFGGVPVVGMR